MKIIWSYFFLCALLLVTANFSKQSSEESNHEHTINFTAIVKPIQGKVFNAIQVSISELINNLQVYAKPAGVTNAQSDPTANATIFDLKKVHSIKRATNHGLPIISHFKNKDYIEIFIQWKNSNKEEHPYIIERNKQIWCYENIPARPLRKIAFEALDYIEFTGYNYQDKTDNASITREQLQQIYTQKIQPLVKKLNTQIEKSASQKELLNTFESLKRHIQELIN